MTRRSAEVLAAAYSGPASVPHPSTATLLVDVLMQTRTRGALLFSRGGVEPEDADEVRGEVLHEGGGVVVSATPSHGARRRRGAATGHEDAHVRQNFPRQQPVDDVVQVPRVVVVGHRHRHCLVERSIESEGGDVVVVVEEVAEGGGEDRARRRTVHGKWRRQDVGIL
jgi:hypothetical protein